jgi:hypothetical protein
MGNLILFGTIRWRGAEIVLYLSEEPISKRFSLVKVKAGAHFNRKNTLSILRIEI